MMELSELSAGWRTDLIAHRVDGLVLERPDCIVLRTPSQPNYYWGNALVLPQPPADGELAHWLARFSEEVGQHDPAIRHVAIGINVAPRADANSLPAWRAAGFALFETETLRLRRGGLQAPRRAPRGEVVFREADLAREAEAFVDLQCVDPEGYEPAGYRLHRTLQMQRLAAMQQAGTGTWFGVWCDGVLAADCGLLRAGALGRFQHVGTHPAWRRRGLCSHLVHRVSAWGFSQWGLQELVMCADPNDVAIGIYESLGYRREERAWGLQRYAPGDGPKAAPGAGGSSTQGGV